VSKALKKHLKQRPSEPELEALFQSMQMDGPRGCAVVASAMVEDVLDGAILYRCVNLSKDERSRLFDASGPLSTFSSKIAIAYAFGIIGPKTRHDLNLLREIRNAFAHAMRTITFDTQEVADMLKTFNALKEPHNPSLKNQMKFVIATRMVMLQLVCKIQPDTPGLYESLD
jgi:Mannitol repressor